MDELKKYLQNHTEELDQDEPRPQVWHNIQQQTQATKKRPVVIMITRWAAAACILSLAGIGVWHMVSDNKTNPATLAAITPKEKKKLTVAPVKPDTIVTKNTEPVVIAKTTHQPKTNKPVTRNSTNPSVNNPEALAALRDMESSFTQVINLQRQRVSSMPMYAESPEYFNDFKIQIRQMERDEKVIKSDIAKRGMNDALLDQLINLYQQKLNTLKQLQTEMNKTNNHYKQNRGPVDSVKTYFLKI
ncbi:MAG: hypothetical protein ABIS69_11860 [Sediminibacterium sp.]